MSFQINQGLKYLGAILLVALVFEANKSEDIIFKILENVTQWAEITILNINTLNSKHTFIFANLQGLEVKKHICENIKPIAVTVGQKHFFHRTARKASE